jgi:hypothetical protein
MKHQKFFCLFLLQKVYIMKYCVCENITTMQLELLNN